MERIGDAFVWPFRDPKWVEKVAIIGLISLIPIVGGINGLGWMLASIERLRAGKEELPPGNFDYLGRGAILFLVLLVYSLAIILVAAVLLVPAIALMGIAGRHDGNAVLGLGGAALMLLAFGVTVLWALAMYFATPAIVLAGDLSPGTAVADQHLDRGPYASGRRLHQRIGVIRLHRRPHLHRPLLAGDGGLDHPELRARLRTETGGGTRCRTFRRPQAVASPHRLHRRAEATHRLLRRHLPGADTSRHHRRAEAMAAPATCHPRRADTCLPEPATRRSGRTAWRSRP